MEWRPLRIDWYDPSDDASAEFGVVSYPVEAPYTVTVEFRRDPEGRAFVTGVAVRYQPLWKWEQDFWQGEGERPNVSARTVQRLPLASIIRAAVAAAARAERPGKWLKSDTARLWPDTSPDPWKGDSAWATEARKILVPRGRPERGKSVDFYRKLADSYREFAAIGRSPVKEIARIKRVSENTVHQWVHRSRKLGFLEPSPRSRRRD